LSKERTKTIEIDQKTKKLLRLVKVSARLARDRENYRKATVELAKTIPKEARSIIAKYTSALRKAIAEPTSENLRVLGELAIQKKQEINSWRAETKEKRAIVSQIAKRFYNSLDEVSKLATELEREFADELVGVE
jgi:LPS O-antigen subunit length determinant protein (WzzB/FepE family)